MHLTNKVLEAHVEPRWPGVKQHWLGCAPFGIHVEAYLRVSQHQPEIANACATGKQLIIRKAVLDKFHS